MDAASLETLTARQIAEHVVRGHKEAADFVELLVLVAHLWDDYVDGDGEADVTLMMRVALVELPRNPFYQAHFPMLSPLVEAAIRSWLTANKLERTDSMDDKVIAFVSRSDYINVVLMAARIVGGHQWAEEVALPLRRFWHRERFDGYVEGLRAQFEKAGVNDVRK